MGSSQSEAWKAAYPPHVQRLAHALAHKRLRDFHLANDCVYFLLDRERYILEPERFEDVIQALVQHTGTTVERYHNLGVLTSAMVITLKLPLTLTPLEE